MAKQWKKLQRADSAFTGDVTGSINGASAASIKSGSALGASSNQDSTSTIRSGVTKSDVGLSNVDNDSTSTIRSGVTKANVGLGNVEDKSAATIMAGTFTGNIGGTSAADIKTKAVAGEAAKSAVDGNAAVTMVGGSINIGSGEWTVDSDGNQVTKGTITINKDSGGDAGLKLDSGNSGTMQLLMEGANPTVDMGGTAPLGTTTHYIRRGGTGNQCRIFFTTGSTIIGGIGFANQPTANNTQLVFHYGSFYDNSSPYTVRDFTIDSDHKIGFWQNDKTFAGLTIGSDGTNKGLYVKNGGVGIGTTNTTDGTLETSGNATFGGEIRTNTNTNYAKLTGVTGGLKLTTDRSGAVGIRGDTASGFSWQLYGETGGDYGFLASAWGAWDIRKQKGSRLYTNNQTTYYLQPETNSHFNTISTAGNATFAGTVVWSGGGSANANTAYGWGNHASAGYGTSNLAIGTSSSTAGRGDKAEIAYNHSQATHAPTNADVTSSNTCNRPLSTSTQQIDGVKTFSSDVKTLARKNFSPAYSSGSDSYQSNFGWRGVQLGNNGLNTIVFGNTAAGGYGEIWVNNAVDLDTDNMHQPGGTKAAKFASDGKVTFPNDPHERGHHGSSTRIKICPADFMPNDDSTTYNVAMVDNGGKIKVTSSSLEAYVQKEIPMGFKATYVYLYGNDGLNSVIIYESYINNTTATQRGSGKINQNINITDITASTTNMVSIKWLPTATSDYCYGGYITIARL